MKVRTGSAAATRAIGAALGRTLHAGDIVVLVGDLGAGKTIFAQGLAHGLDVEGPVTSPSFTLVQEYRGRLPVAHVDVYRLARIQELHDLGFEELIDGERVTIIEWGDAVEQLLPADHVVVRIELGATDDERTLTVDRHGPRARDEREAFDAALAAAASEIGAEP
jgi:tRNA threonylcarbamoyladenosine biosynthesis protein TsaE